MTTPEVVVVEAVRTPFGRRNGALSAMHPLDVLAVTQRELFARSGVDPTVVGQVVGGCVLQVGMQAMNVTRNAWLAAGLPVGVAATTVDAQCGSSQQAAGVAYALVKAGLVDVAVGCGVEVMSRIPMGSTFPDALDLGSPWNDTYEAQYELTTQFEAAERLARLWGLSRETCEEFGKLSQDRAAAAWANGRFDGQIVLVDVPVLDEQGARTGQHTLLARDEGLRDTTLEGLAKLKSFAGDDGVHTAGTSSQISDGAAAVLLMTKERASELGVEPLATIVDSCLVGCDPVLMLEGPIVATRKLLAESGLTMADLDVVEINEAFASVVLAWEADLKADMEKVNPNGGAIALGHPLGATGVGLLTKAVHELIRTDTEHALVTMCCGGGLGTGTLLRRS